MIKQEMKKKAVQTASTIIERFEQPKRKEITLADDMPLARSYHHDFRSEYQINGNTNELISAQQFADSHIIQEFNNTNENKKLISDFIRNIKSEEYSVGNDINKELCTELVKNTYKSESQIIDKTLTILGNPEKAPIQLIEDTGNSLVHLYSAAGNLPRKDALQWYFNQIQFGPPKSLEPLRMKIQRNEAINEEIQNQIKDLSDTNLAALNKISQNVSRELDQGIIDKFFQTFDINRILSTLLEHKVVTGGAITVTLGAGVIYVYNNPKIFIQWYEFINNSNQLTVVDRINDNARPTRYKKISQIEKESLEKIQKLPTKKLLEALVDKFYQNFKNYFFKN